MGSELKCAKCHDNPGWKKKEKKRRTKEPEVPTQPGRDFDFGKAMKEQQERVAERKFLQERAAELKYLQERAAARKRKQVLIQEELKRREEQKRREEERKSKGRCRLLERLSVAGFSELLF